MMKPRAVVFVVVTVIFLAFSLSHANATLPIDSPPLTDQQIADFEGKAAHGDVEAQKRLGLIYFVPDYWDLKSSTPKEMHKARGDNKEALKYFMQAAQSGDALAQTYVGFIYDNGKGVDRDYKAALKWYKMAEAQGFSAAQDLIGRMYRDGHGVPQNYSLAAGFFKKATLQFYANSQVHLARLYFTGGLEWPQDYEKAFFWLVLPENPAWPKGHLFADTLCCEFEDFYNPFYLELKKHLTPEQIAKIRQQVRDYKMPPRTKWSPPFTPAFAPHQFNKSPPQPNNLQGQQ